MLPFQETHLNSLLGQGLTCHTHCVSFTFLKLWMRWNFPLLFLVEGLASKQSLRIHSQPKVCQYQHLFFLLVSLKIFLIIYNYVRGTQKQRLTGVTAAQ